MFASYFKPSVRPLLLAAKYRSLYAFIELGLFSEIFIAISFTLESNSFIGNASKAIPYSTAWMPDIVFAVNDNSLARAIPIYFGNLCVSPHEGLKPRIAWVSPNLASFAIYIRSADSATSNPPVKQKPFIFDITALGEFSSNLITSLACLSNSFPTPH